jgi:hypothetical protein
VYLELRDEIVELVGTWAYERFVEHVEGVTRARGTGSFLPHPALRRS